MRKRSISPVLAIALPLWVGACEPDTLTEANERETTAADPVLEALSASGDWEVTANPISLSEGPIEDVRIGDYSESALADGAARDLAWHASDGARYDALYVHQNGKAYGRRGPAAQTRAFPNESNDFGAFIPKGRIDDEVLASVLGPADSVASEQGALAQRINANNWQQDRRYRVSWTTSYPTRTIGAMSGNGNTQSGSCSGTKIGPRAVLTAAHCVMGASGNIALSGRFNPGQTSYSTPNGSLVWSGVFLRDWRVHRRYDYAVVYLQDSPATVGLGWMGVAWWNGAAGYTGRWASLFGYPCGANTGCGQVTAQRCKASPLASKRCNGWMYGHARPLWASSYRNDGLLQYDNDMSSGQSGSAVYTWLGNSPAVMAVNTHSTGGISRGARFRQSMWNDVCAWIAHPAVQSAYATHSLCN